ncbi:MAG: hypothetical protein ABW321_07895 [Polyangiales bacterium]
MEQVVRHVAHTNLPFALAALTLCMMTWLAMTQGQDTWVRRVVSAAALIASLLTVAGSLAIAAQQPPPTAAEMDTLPVVHHAEAAPVRALDAANTRLGR